MVAVRENGLLAEQPGYGLHETGHSHDHAGHCVPMVRAWGRRQVELGGPAWNHVADRVLDAYRTRIRPLVLVFQRQSEHGPVHWLRSSTHGSHARPVAA